MNPSASVAEVNPGTELPSTPVAVIYHFRGSFVPGEGLEIKFVDEALNVDDDGLAFYLPELDEFAPLGAKSSTLGAGWLEMHVGSPGDLTFVTDGSSVHPVWWSGRHTALADCEAEYGGAYWDSSSIEYSFGAGGRGGFCGAVALQDYSGAMPIDRFYAEIQTIYNIPNTTTVEDWAGYQWPSGNGAYEGHYWYYTLANERQPTEDQWLPQPLPGASQIVGLLDLGLWQYDAYDPADPDPDNSHPTASSTYHSSTQWVFGFPEDASFNFSGRVVGHYGEVDDTIDNDWDGAVNDGFTCGECCVESSSMAANPYCNSGIADCPAWSECLYSVGSSIGVCGDIGGEVLDGVDNDCDGVADNNMFCGECCADNTGGFCFGLTSECPSGWTCQGASTIGTCVANDPTEILDAVDNDCDGLVDEGAVCGGCCFDPLGTGLCADSLLPTSCAAGSVCGGGWQDDGTCFPTNGDPCL